MASDDDAPYRAGQALGNAILACFEAIAAMDGRTLTDVMDEWVQSYVAERIVHPEGWTPGA